MDWYDIAFGVLFVGIWIVLVSQVRRRFGGG